MKIDFSPQLKKDDGSPLWDEMLSADKTELIDSANPFTLKMATTRALLATIPKEEIDGEEKYKRFKLRQKLDEGKVVEVKAEEIALIKKLIGKVFNPNIVGQCYDLLEKVKEDKK